MDVRRRILTRIAWLGVSQQEFARAIQMDKGSLSRAVRSRRPRPSTLQRIAAGLDLTVGELMSDDPDVLLRPHPAVHPVVAGDPGLAADCLAAWFAAGHAGGS